MAESVLYRIVDWDQHFESSRSRVLKSLQWISMPNKHDGDGYTELILHPDGVAHFGAFILILEVASKCNPRGTLIRDNGLPHDSASLSRVTRVPVEIFDAVISRLLEIGWIEEVIMNTPLTEIVQEGAGIVQEGAGIVQDIVLPEDKEDKEDNTKKTGKAGVLSLVSLEILADPKRVLDWFKQASTGKGKVLEPTEGNKRYVVHTAQRVLRNEQIENPVGCFVDCVKKKNFKMTNTEEDRAVAAIKLIERGPPSKRTSDLSSKNKSKEQQLREAREWIKKNEK